MDFSNPKHPFRSKTILSGFAGVLLGVVGLVYAVPEGVTQDSVGTLMWHLTELVAGAGAIYGRYKANRPVR